MIERIENLGWNATENEVIKNGVKKIGITFGKGNDVVKPTFYPTPEMETWSDEELGDFLEKVYNDTPDFDKNEIVSPEYILENSYVCLQQTSEEDIVKREFLDLEEYIRVKVYKNTSYKLTPQMVGNMDIDTIFEKATENVCPTIRHIAGMVPMAPDEVPMWVLTNDSGVNGASTMLLTDVLDKFCEEQGVDEITIIPSSIHEVILLTELSPSVEQLAKIIQIVNEQSLLPEEILSSHPYKYSRKEGCVWM